MNQAQPCESLQSHDSLGGRTRVWLDVDTPDLRVEVESLEGSVSAQVLEDINVLVDQLWFSLISIARKNPDMLTSLPP